MREILLILGVLVLCAVAVVKPRIGLLAYVSFAIVRPDALAWSYGHYPYSMALAVTTIIGSLRFAGNIVFVLTNPIALLLISLQVPIILSAVFAVEPALSFEPLKLYGRMIAMALLIPMLVRSESDLRRMLLAIGLSLGFLGAKFGLYGLLRGGVTLVSGHAGLMGDNNDLALGLTMGVPICWHARRLVPWRWAKFGLWAMVFVSIAAIVMTHSRGAALALGMAFLTLALQSERKTVVLALLVLLALPAIHLVHETYLPRLASLNSLDEETSASLRLIYARGAIEMWRDYPWLGVGFGSLNQMEQWPKYMSAARRSTPQVIHNTYLQMLVDSGTLALVLYAGLLLGTIFWLGRSAERSRRETPGAQVYPMAIQACLVAFAVGCTFFSRVQFDLAYMVLMCAAAWYGIRHQLREKEKRAVLAPTRPASLVAGRAARIRIQS